MSNDFLPFATGAGANVVTQPQYAALSAVTNGFSAGIAQSAQLNKVWRQSSIMAAVLAQFIADEAAVSAIDDGTTATLLANLKTGVGNLATASMPAASTSVSGILKLATAALVNGGTDNVTAITPLALNSAMPASIGSLGSFSLPNGLIVNWGTLAGIVAGTTTVQAPLQHTWPIGFLAGFAVDVGPGCIPYGINAGSGNSTVAVMAPQYVVSQSSASIVARGLSGAFYMAIGH